jgi:hypothetical protein
MNTIINEYFNNNSQRSIGVYPQKDGSFLALTLTWSKEFKTYNGAVKALRKRGVNI